MYRKEMPESLVIYETFDILLCPQATCANFNIVRIWKGRPVKVEQGNDSNDLCATPRILEQRICALGDIPKQLAVPAEAHGRDTDR